LSSAGTAVHVERRVAEALDFEAEALQLARAGEQRLVR